MADKAGGNVNREEKEKEAKDGKTEATEKRPRGRPKKVLEEKEEAASMLKFLGKGNVNLAFAKGAKVMHSPPKTAVEKVDKEDIQDKSEGAATSLAECSKQDKGETEGAADDGKMGQEAATREDRRDKLSGATDDGNEKAEGERGVSGVNAGELGEKLKKWEEFVLEYESEKEALKREIGQLKAQVEEDRLEKDRLREELHEIRNELKAKSDQVEGLTGEFRFHRDAINEEVLAVRSSLDRLEEKREELRSRSVRDRNKGCDDYISDESESSEGCEEMESNMKDGEGGGR